MANDFLVPGSDVGINGAPIGLSMIGTKGADAQLAAVAVQLEAQA